MLIVTGGNEIRSGPAGVNAALAARLAEQGFPVFRYDRRGIGDSEGDNAGFKGAGDDLVAAFAAFRAAAPEIKRIVAFGNCDAASQLMLNCGASADALALANPWTFDDDEGEAEAASPHALRAHYRARLTSGAALKRVLRGEVKFGAAFRSVIAMLRPAPEPGGLIDDMRRGLADFCGDWTILIAGRDRTGQEFRGAWSKSDERLAICPSATHAFVEPESLDWLEEQLVKLLEK